MDSVTQKVSDIGRNKESILTRIFNLFEIRDKTQEKELNVDVNNDELINELNHAKMEWESANQSFEFANEEEMIDYYTYKIKACQLRYEFFIKQAKQKQAN